MKSKNFVSAAELFGQALKLINDYDDTQTDSTNTNSELMDSVKSDGSLKKSKSIEVSYLEETYGIA